MPLLNKEVFEPLPAPQNCTGEVFQIRFTSEIFLTYEEYIARLEMYRERIWGCKMTGRTGLTYEEALLSERRSSSKADLFPDTHLRPLLFMVHESQLTLDALTDHVYNYFKTHYVVGESVEYINNGNKGKGIIAALVSIDNTDINVDEGIGYVFSDKRIKGTRLASPKAYKVKMGGNTVVTLPPEALSRKKLPYSKPMLRQKIKLVTLPREHLPDAYWLLFPQVISENQLNFDQIKAWQEDFKASGKRKRDYFDEHDGNESEIDEITYPVDDEEIRRNPSLPNDPPPGSNQWVVPQQSVGDFLMVWHFLDNFSETLHLSPFSLEDFEQAIIYHMPVELITQTHLSLLKLIMHDKHAPENTPPKTLNRDTWMDILRICLEKILNSDGEHFENGIESESEDERSLEKSRDSSENSENINPNEDFGSLRKNGNGIIESANKKRKKSPAQTQYGDFEQVFRILGDGGWTDLEITDRVRVLRVLCDRALEAVTVRSRIEEFIGVTKELKKEEREQALKIKKLEKEAAENKIEDKREAAQKQKQQESLDLELSKHVVKHAPLGYDRHRNRYWYWQKLPGRIMIELFGGQRWFTYSTSEELVEFINWLDDRGKREKALKETLQRKQVKIVNAMEKRARDILQALQLQETVKRRSERIKSSEKSREKPFMGYLNKLAPS